MEPDDLADGARDALARIYETAEQVDHLLLACGVSIVGRVASEGPTAQWSRVFAALRSDLASVRRLLRQAAHEHPEAEGALRPILAALDPCATPPSEDALCEALEQSFPTFDVLREAVRYGTGASLDELTTEAPLRERVRALVTVLRYTGRLRGFLEQAVQNVGEDSPVARWYERWRSHAARRDLTPAA